MGQWVPIEQAVRQNAGYMKQTYPALYSQYIKDVEQPTATLGQTAASTTNTQANTARTAAELPAVAAQTQATTQNIALPTDQAAPNTQATTPTTQTAIQDIKNTYQKAWQTADTAAKRDSIAKSYKDATGTDLFQLYLPGQDLSQVTTSLAVKEQINQIKDGMQSDSKLKDIVGNPLYNAVIPLIIQTPGGQATVQKALGISDKGMQALSNFIKLQGAGDRQLVGGRISGYMIDYFGSAQPGLGRSYSDNLNQLNNMSGAMDKNLNVYAKNNGFQKWQDVPGLDQYGGASQSSKPDLSTFFKK